MNVRTLCLGILYFGDASGYEIRKMAQEGPFSHFIAASFGAIYPALMKMEAEGLVTGRTEQQTGKPDRKMYAITDAGRDAFRRALHEDPQDDILKSEFLLIMMCADQVDRSHVSKVLDDRIAHLDAMIDHLVDAQDCCKGAGSTFVIGYALAMYRATRTYLHDNRHSIETVSHQADAPALAPV